MGCTTRCVCAILLGLVIAASALGCAGLAPPGGSNVAAGTTLIPAPDVPGFVEATPGNGATTVTWATDGLEEGLVVQRQANGGAWQTVAEPVAGVESYVDTLPDPTDEYGYRVKSVNGAGESPFSDVAIAGATPSATSTTQIPRQHFLISFYGADPGEVDIDGNVRFLRESIYRITRDARNFNPLNLDAAGVPYRDFHGPRAFRDLLAAIDHDGDRRITAAEIDAVRVRVLGWSLGAVASVNFSRVLTDTVGLAGAWVWGSRYRLEKAVPIEQLVLIDAVHDGLAPLTTIFPHGSIKTNATRVSHFYQRRGGVSTLDLYLPGAAGAPAFPAVRSETYRGSRPYPSDILGVDLLGQPLRLEGGASNLRQNIRVDTHPNYVGVPLVHPFRNEFGDQEFDGLLRGDDVNHSTIVWYVQQEAVDLLVQGLLIG